MVSTACPLVHWLVPWARCCATERARCQMGPRWCPRLVGGRWCRWLLSGMSWLHKMGWGSHPGRGKSIGCFWVGFTGHDTEFPIFPCFQFKLTGKDGREKGAEFYLLFKNEGFLRFRGDGAVLGASFWHFHHITYHHLFPSSFSNLPSGAVESLAAARHQRSHASAPEVPPAAPCLPRRCHRWAAHGGEELVGGWTANAVPLHRGGGFGMFLGVFVGLYTIVFVMFLP